MIVDLVHPFVTATRSVFSTMLDCEIERGCVEESECFQPQHEISGIIGLSGDASATVIVSLDRQVATRATATLLGDQTSEVNQDVVDTVGELTNMIAGGAKSSLDPLSVSISLPTVIVAQQHVVAFNTNVRALSIPFRCEWGTMSIEIGIPKADFARFSLKAERQSIG